MAAPPQRGTQAGGAGGFATTRWSVVLAAGRPTAASRDALATLCGIYWYPLYAYIRRRGHVAGEAEDLTQGFFARFLEKNYLRVVKPELGKFRSYLLGALKHYLSNEADRARAQKRGGGRTPVPLDFDAAESRYRLEPSHDETPERIFERRWALALLDRVLSRLEEEHRGKGKGALFEALKPYLAGAPAEATLAAAGAAIGLGEGAAKQAVHRLRRRYRELLREEIAHTVADPADIEGEIRHLFEALGS